MQVLSDGEQERRDRQRLLSRKELGTVKGIPFSDATLYRKIKDGSFPRPAKIGDNTNGWVEAEIDAWAAEKIAARDSLKGAA